MIFELPELLYALNDLSPVLSAETMEYHYLKHHKTYVDNLNKLVIGTEFEGKDLEHIVKHSSKGPIFNNSAQIWNHTFYFTQFSKARNPINNGKLSEMIDSKWGSQENFIQEFNKSAVSNFGSGWTWLVNNLESSELEIINTANAETPITNERYSPLLTVDIWEHAYYIDYRNKRAEYLDNIWKIIDWSVIENRL